MSSLSFFGAAGTVTGSCTLLETGSARILIDCGLFQGNRSVRELNSAPFPFDAATLDAMLLTHAHTDHAGLIPKLIAKGFLGSIYATPATADLLEFMMRDSARIQESEAKRENRRRQRSGKEPLPPLFTLEDAEVALDRIQTVEYETELEPVPGLIARFWNAGHILGSASIDVAYTDTDSGHKMRILFSGDLGPDEKAFHSEPDAERGYDYVVCESTYGNRERDQYTLDVRRAALREELVAGLARGGNIVIPCFAVERSQELLHDIGVMLARDEISAAQVFLDSPLARKVTEVFVRHAHTLEDIDIPEEELFRDPRFHIVESVEESKGINRIKGGAIIISASGMADAGRVVHHLKNNIWRKEATVLFVGYQAPGTTGFHIGTGAERVFLHGKEFKIEARIRSIGNYSAHADQSELLSWILERRPIAGGIFLNHGDDPARAKLKSLLVEQGVAAEDIVLPQFDEEFDLSAASPVSKGRTAERISHRDLQEDWNETFEAFVLDLERRLEAAPDVASRKGIISRLQVVLAEI